MKPLYFYTSIFLIFTISIVFAAETPSAPEVEKIRYDLSYMVKRDQKIRNEFNEASKKNPNGIYLRYLALKMGFIDLWNTHNLKKIINKWGWPKISVFGADADQNAWLLIQHADHSVDFQKQCLLLIEALVLENETKRSNAAYLSDRVAVREGRAQKFGTQGDISSTTQCWEAKPTEDARNLDKRREDYELEPFIEYRCKVNQYVGLPQCCN